MYFLNDYNNNSNNNRRCTFLCLLVQEILWCKTSKIIDYKIGSWNTQCFRKAAQFRLTDFVCLLFCRKIMHMRRAGRGDWRPLNAKTCSICLCFPLLVNLVWLGRGDTPWPTALDGGGAGTNLSGPWFSRSSRQAPAYKFDRSSFWLSSPYECSLGTNCGPAYPWMGP